MTFKHFIRLQSAFLKYVPGSSGVKTSSFNLRLILWEAGITVSNKVLECLILRFAKNKLLSSEAYVIVMIRLHLAHGKIHDKGHVIREIHDIFNSRTISQHRHQDEGQPTLPGGNDSHDNLFMNPEPSQNLLLS